MSLPTPTITKSLLTNTTVSISVNPNSNPDYSAVSGYYNINGGPNVPLGGPDPSTVPLTGLTASTNYSITVTYLYTGSVDPITSSPVVFTTFAGPPPTPALTRNYLLNTSVNITVNPNNNADYVAVSGFYNIGGANVPIPTPLTSPQTFSISGLSQSTFYSLFIGYSYNDGIVNQTEPQTFTTLSNPPNPTISSANLTNTSADLTVNPNNSSDWTASSGTYQVNSLTPVALPTPAGSPYTFTVPGLTQNTAYSVVVRYIYNNNSPPITSSSPATFTTLYNPPTPTKVVGTPTQTTVVVTPSPNLAHGYTVQSSSYTFQKGTDTPVTRPFTTSPFTINGLDANSPYKVFVSYIYVNGTFQTQSINSTTSSFTTKAPNPPTVTIVAGIQNAVFTITPDLTGITSYQNVALFINDGNTSERVFYADTGPGNDAVITKTAIDLKADSFYISEVTVVYTNPAGPGDIYGTTRTSFDTLGTSYSNNLPLPSGILQIPPSPSNLVFTFPDIHPQLNPLSTVSALMMGSSDGVGDATNCWIVSASCQSQFGGSIVITLAGNPTGTLTIAYQIESLFGVVNSDSLLISYPLAAAPAEPNLYAPITTYYGSAQQPTGAMLQIVVNVPNTGNKGFIFYVYQQSLTTPHNPDPVFTDYGTIFARVDVGITNNTYFLLSVAPTGLFTINYTSYTASTRESLQSVNAATDDGNYYQLLTPSQAGLSGIPEPPVITGVTFTAPNILNVTLNNILQSDWVYQINYIVGLSPQTSGAISGSIRFNASTGATSATITIPANIPDNQTPIIHTSLTNIFGTSGQSNTWVFSAPPIAPADFAATGNINGTALLTWTNGTTPPARTGYYLYVYRTDVSLTNPEQTIQLGSGLTQYVVTGLAVSTPTTNISYTFKLEAYNSSLASNSTVTILMPVTNNASVLSVTQTLTGFDIVGHFPKVYTNGSTQGTQNLVWNVDSGADNTITVLPQSENDYDKTIHIDTLTVSDNYQFKIVSITNGVPPVNQSSVPFTASFVAPPAPATSLTYSLSPGNFGLQDVQLNWAYNSAGDPIDAFFVQAGTQPEIKLGPNDRAYLFVNTGQYGGLVLKVTAVNNGVRSSVAQVTATLPTAPDIIITGLVQVGEQYYAGDPNNPTLKTVTADTSLIVLAYTTKQNSVQTFTTTTNLNNGETVTKYGAIGNAWGKAVNPPTLPTSPTYYPIYSIMNKSQSSLYSLIVTVNLGTPVLASSPIRIATDSNNIASFA
jgi:hypothetical protein